MVYSVSIRRRILLVWDYNNSRVIRPMVFSFRIFFVKLVFCICIITISSVEFFFDNISSMELMEAIYYILPPQLHSLLLLYVDSASAQFGIYNAVVREKKSLHNDLHGQRQMDRGARGFSISIINVDRSLPLFDSSTLSLNIPRQYIIITHICILAGYLLRA